MSLTLGERFDLYLDTLNNFGVFLLDLPDALIEYYVFEEFATGAISFLYKTNLELYEDEGLITKAIREQSGRLREGFLALKLQGETFWRVESVKRAPEWRELLTLSDCVKALLHERWTDEELKMLCAIGYCRRLGF